MTPRSSRSSIIEAARPYPIWKWRWRNAVEQTPCFMNNSADSLIMLSGLGLTVSGETSFAYSSYCFLNSNNSNRDSYGISMDASFPSIYALSDKFFPPVLMMRLYHSKSTVLPVLFYCYSFAFSAKEKPL